MKKLLAAVLAVLIIIQPMAIAEKIMKNSLLFEPIGGGKFIYCNNPEELIREDLADDGETPEFLMNNEDLTEDNYRVYITHFNRISKVDEENTYPGENVWFDAIFTAKEDCEIEILRTGFEVPENITTYLNYETIQTEDTWSALYACANLLGKPIYTLHSDKVFSHQEQKVQKLALKKGETAFLSAFIDNYSSVPYPKHVFMAADFVIKTGKADLDIFAAKNRLIDIDGNVSYPDVDFEACGFGIYKRGRTHKGIADSLPEMHVNLEYDIGDHTKDGAYLPAIVYNEHYPKGIAVTEWTTNLNPQDDMYAEGHVVESDMLPLKYKDKSKLNYYGENVPEEDRDDVWYFDTKHSDTMEYPGEFSGYTQADYIPNYVLDLHKDNVGYACSMGNYGVTLRYNLKITNNGTMDRWFDYTVLTGANVIVEVLDKEGEPLQPVISKGQTSSITEDVMASVCLPAGETTEFSVGMTLPVQNYGGQQQSFRIRNRMSKLDFKKMMQIKPVLAEDDVVEEYDIDELLKKADERTKMLFEGNLDDLQIIKTDDGFAAYFKTTAGNPWYYGYYWEITGKVFIFDSDFNLIKEIYPGSQPIEMTYVDGKIYVKTIANGSFYIDDTLEIQPYDSFILPRENGAAIINAKDGELLVSDDGEKYYNVVFQEKKAPFAEVSGNVFYWATKDGAAVSKDGIYWNYVKREVSEIKVGDGFITVDGDRLSVIGKDAPRVRINNQILSFDTLPVIKEERILVPMRFIFENLGMNVFFEGKEGRIIAIGKNILMEFVVGSDAAMVNGKEIMLDTPAEIIEGRAFVPLRFISENCGFDVTWEDKTNTAVIIGEIENAHQDVETDGNISVEVIDDTKETNDDKGKENTQDNEEVNTADSDEEKDESEISISK